MPLARCYLATLALFGPLFVAGWAHAELPLVYSENFEQGAGRWEPTDASAWRVKPTAEGPVYSQFKKRSNYDPPHRSPYNIALLKDINVSDFELLAEVRSTHPDYGHRDVCLFFGYQDPAHFYYVHLGKKADAHANQIFIVNDKPRTKISSRSTPGTDWDDAWHRVKIVRNTASGKIEVYFDDLQRPVMVAEDTTFRWGRVGIGSFDDTSDWRRVTLHGTQVKPEGR